MSPHTHVARRVEATDRKQELGERSAIVTLLPHKLEGPDEEPSLTCQADVRSSCASSPQLTLRPWDAGCMARR